MNWTMTLRLATMEPDPIGSEGAISPLLIYLLALDDPSLEPEFRRFFHKYSPAAFRAARRHLDKQLAQDAVQDAFLQLAACFSVVAALSPRQQKSYLLITVRNCAIDLMRREGRYAGLSEEETLPGGLDPAQAAQAAAGYDALVAAVLAMPPTYREILERRLVLEQTPAEVAAATGLSVELVNTRFSRGRKLLRERLLKEGMLNLTGSNCSIGKDIRFGNESLRGFSAKYSDSRYRIRNNYDDSLEHIGFSFTVCKDGTATGARTCNTMIRFRARCGATQFQSDEIYSAYGYLLTD